MVLKYLLLFEELNMNIQIAAQPLLCAPPGLLRWQR